MKSCKGQLSVGMLLGMLALSVGCGKPDFYKCDGVVTLDGKPIENLQITFQPDNPDTRPPLAMTDAEGKFEMTTGREYGVKPGSYIINIEDPAAANGGKTSSEPDYVYVVGRYGPGKSDLKYEADSHRTGYQISLKKE
jgi:hypothetical protein